ncbi:uncharacterized protein PGTG_18933 [Puccinia graminis f. sp. tritici CRL 75-36-700-3]|uniref:Uncharacterized protein n=1 Tax=Puccinia graminis f. sp. tritici (strain CRL 75-36-700-3 / race SCCL) TaxID=418459 RepID=E3LAE4_PUCGT|nr:uncharacterized protein PGTG_18933 [Puccinia graminis f. sp. tritici CRL 75-36-700-3]EFP93519.2 hypothetical protein PGTG_18933 [Puccinia graminis f. sp. tritici CRL 75-36-700-3]
MEGEGHKDITTSNRWGIDLANANRIEQIQAQIASYCSKKKVLSSLVPDALVIWNIHRVRLVRANWDPTTGCMDPLMERMDTKN